MKILIFIGILLACLAAALIIGYYIGAAQEEKYIEGLLKEIEKGED